MSNQSKQSNKQGALLPCTPKEMSGLISTEIKNVFFFTAFMFSRLLHLPCTCKSNVNFQHFKLYEHYLWCDQSKWVWSLSNSIFWLIVQAYISCKSYLLQDPIEIDQLVPTYGKVLGQTSDKLHCSNPCVFSVYMCNATFKSMILLSNFCKRYWLIPWLSVQRKQTRKEVCLLFFSISVTFVD